MLSISAPHTRGFFLCRLLESRRLPSRGSPAFFTALSPCLSFRCGVRIGGRYFTSLSQFRCMHHLCCNRVLLCRLHVPVAIPSRLR